MFAGINAVVCGVVPLVRAAKLKELIVAHGGSAEVHKAVAALFVPKNPTELPPTVTHIITGMRDIGSLCKKMNIACVPPPVTIVSDQWITASIAQKSLQAVTSYLIIAEADINNKLTASNEVVISSTKEDSIVDAPSYKRPVAALQEGSDSIGQRNLKKSKVNTQPIRPGVWENITYGDDSAVQGIYKVFGGKTDAAEMVAFDLDGTIIETKSGKRFATDRHDWKFFHPSIPQQMKQLVAEGKQLAIISNQNGVGSKVTVDEIKAKVDDILTQLDCPIDVVCAFRKDFYRKPRIGSFDLLKQLRVEDTAGLTFTYVGDAAGRPKSGTRKKDFAATDLAFALNCSAQVCIQYYI